MRATKPVRSEASIFSGFFFLIMPSLEFKIEHREAPHLSSIMAELIP